MSLQAALIAMSGTPRAPPTTDATPPWKDGRLNHVERPPPLATGDGVTPTTFLSNVSFHATG